MSLQNEFIWQQNPTHHLRKKTCPEKFSMGPSLPYPCKNKEVFMHTHQPLFCEKLHLLLEMVKGKTPGWQKLLSYLFTDDSFEESLDRPSQCR